MTQTSSYKNPKLVGVVLPGDGHRAKFQIFVAEEKHRKTENSPNSSYVYLKTRSPQTNISKLFLT